MTVEFATFDDLHRFTNKLPPQQRSMIKASAAQRRGNEKDTFLSHSSKDAEYLPGLIKLLESHGASVYCDLEDCRMPDKPNPTTASIIKDQIKVCRRLVLFVTVNSKGSMWVPWELGIGDSVLSPKNVALFPTSATSGDQSWAQQEYLGLYRHIVWGDLQGFNGKIWMVYDYRINEAVPLKTWFR